MHLREDVVDAGRLDDGAHRAAGDDARSGRRRAEEHAAGAEVTDRRRAGSSTPSSGTLNRFLRAWSLPLRIASGTSFALPRPTPT